MFRCASLARRLSATLPKCAPAKSIPRTSSITIAPTQYIPPDLSSMISARGLSSSSRSLDSILQREIAEETDAGAGSNSLPEELSQLHDDISKQWTIVQGLTGIGSDETGSGATIRMFKKDSGSNGAKIGIVFHCQDTEEDNAFDENMFDEGAESVEEQEEEPATAVRFGVTVSKGGHTVVFQCRSSEDHLSVESVAVRDGDAEGALIALAGGEELHSSLYQVSIRG